MLDFHRTSPPIFTRREKKSAAPAKNRELPLARTGQLPPLARAQGSWLPRLLKIAALSVPLVTGLLLAWHSLGELDIWLHDRAGRDILAGQGFSGTNTYSFTEPDHPWTNHEWLFQVAAAWTGPGTSGALDPAIARWNLLRTGLAAILLGLLVAGDGQLKRRGVPWQPGWWDTWLAVPLLLGLLLLWTRLLLRPELVSYILLVLVVRTLDHPLGRLSPTGRWTDLVSPQRPLGRAFWLTVLWVQFHGFSALAAAVMVLALAARQLEAALPGAFIREPARNRLWLWGLPLLLAGLCLSPNGLEGLLYPLQAVGQFRDAQVDLRGSISELVPLLQTRDSLGLTRLAFLVSLGWGALWVGLTWGKTSLLRVLLWMAAAAAAWAGQRNLGLYAVAFVLLHTGTRTPVLPSWLEQPLQRLPRPAVGGLGLVLALAVAITWWVQIGGDGFYLAEGVSRRFGTGANPGRYPESAAQLLQASKGLRLFSNLDGAAYLLDRADVRLFIDGRTEAYSPAMWARYEKIKAGDDQALALLRNARCQAVFLSVQTGAFRPLAQALLQADDWTLAQLDQSGLLFAPGGSRAVPPRISSLAGLLPEPGDQVTSARAADLCLAWALTLDTVADPALQEQALRRGLGFRPDHPALQHNLGNLLLARGEFQAALPLFTGALAVNPRLAGSALNAGVCHLRLGQAAQARNFFARATRIDGSSFQAWANLGQACRQLGQDAQALRAFRQALALQPGNSMLQTMVRQLSAAS